MLKARATIGGKDTYLIGLSFGNLDKFRAGPGDSFIRIPATRPGTKLIISDRLKQS